MEEKENIKLAFFLNLGFSIFELIGGLFTHSVAIFSDAIHDFGDSLAIGLSYILENVSNKKSDKYYTYGYKRYSILSAMFSSMILLFGSLIIIFNAFIRIFRPDKINLTGMFIFAIFGLVINGYATYKTSKGDSLNEKSVNLHMLEDVLGWLAVLIGSLLIKITGWYIIDPILSILIALFIGFTSFKHLWSSLEIILERVPNEIDIDLITKKVKNINHILDVHHIHVWSIDGLESFITIHVLVKNVTKKNYEEVKTNVKKCLEEFNIYHSTVEIEYENCKEIECN